MKESIEKLKELFKEHEARISRIENAIFSTPIRYGKKRSEKKKLAIKEFLRMKKPANDVQKTLAIGHYLEKYEKLQSFNVIDLRKGFSDAKEKLPSNLNAFINQNIKNGHIMKVDEKKDNKKTWTLTATGESFVENNFESETGGKYESRI